MAECNHPQCMICGGRICSVGVVKPYGDINACQSCARLAVQFTYNTACKFGGGLREDVCGYKKVMA